MPLLKPIIDCDETSFLAIAGAKQGQRRTRLTNSWPEIKRRYTHYDRRSASLETLLAANFTDRRKNDCKHCYDSPTKPLSTLIARVLKILPTSNSTMCQYCLIGEIDSVDHYAPKDLFPEFSVFPRNLVASCSLCNRLKNAKWVNHGVREIISLYYDDLPTAQFLHVDVHFPAGDRAKVSFGLLRPSGITKALFKRIERQFEILDLIERYNKVGAEYVSELLISTKSLPATGKAAAKRFLKKVAGGLEAQFGVNHMKRLICLELASNDDFMNVAGMS